MANHIVEALEEIGEGKGPYSRDQLTYAENTIDAMKALAIATVPLAQQQAKKVERLRALVQKYEHHHAIIATLGKEHDRPWDGTREAELGCDCDICQQARKELNHEPTS